MGIRPRFLPPVAPPQENSATKPRREISASTLAWPRPWRTSHLADGKIASSVFCMGRVAMRWSSIPNRKWLSSAGQGRKPENSNAAEGMNTKPLQLDVNKQIECAHTLASKFYTDPTIHDIEKTRIFLRTWQLVGTLSHACGEVDGAKRTIADPESFFTAEVVGEPVIVVRDKQGVLRAFSNVCRHRAGPIALGSGCKNVLRCQYHGWTYTLDGRLIGTPDVEGVEFFDRSTMGMVPLRVEVWERFIFVNFDAQAEPLASYLGKIPEQVHGFQFEGLQFAERRDYVINCNWKVYVDNYLEGYHIPIAHQGLIREIDYAHYRTDTYRYYSQQFVPIRAMKAEDRG